LRRSVRIANTGEEFGYITGKDTPEYGSNRHGAVSDGLTMVEINAIARSSSALQMLIVFDACFSGNIFTIRSPVTSVPFSAQQSTQLSRCSSRTAMTGTGHEDAFLAVRLNGRCRMRKRSVAADD